MVKFLFIQNEFENIGVEYLSAGLKQNHHRVELVFFPYPKSEQEETRVIFKKIDEYKPDIVAFSPFSSQYYWAIKKAKLIKKRNSKMFILFGGVHINSVPDLVIREKVIDGIIIGEADETILELAKNFGGDLTKCPSLWYKKKKLIIKNKMAPLEENLDKFPPPDKALFYEQMPEGLKTLPYTAMGSRGCPFACTYCSNNIYQRLYVGQKRLRYRSPESIVAEIYDAKQKYHFKRVEFSDDVLAIDMDRLKKLTRLYKLKVNLPFACFFHPQMVSVNTIKYLKKGGCDWMKLGLQSANEAYRHQYLNRHETNKQVLKVAKLCHRYGLGFSIDHIFNLPGETKDHLVEAVKFYNLCRPSTINFGGLMYLPGTDIIKYGLKFKSIKNKDLAKINIGQHQLSRQYQVPWYFYKQKQNKVNPSIFMLMFILITILPARVINWLVGIKLYNWPYAVPNWVIVPLKIISKLKGGQIYLYADGIKQRVVKRLAISFGKN